MPDLSRFAQAGLYDPYYDPGTVDPGNVRTTWGRRVLLATNQTNPAPYLVSARPKSSETIVDTGHLGQAVPIHVEVRFASPTIGGLGAPILPFSDFAPAVLGNDVVLKIVVRRGIDQIAPVTVDTYTMPVGINNGINDRVPFDVITCEALAVDVELYGNDNPASALWVEAVATPVDFPSQRALVGGYNSTVGGPTLFPAQPISILLAPRRLARKQIIIVNTSTNGDLFVGFASVVLPAAATLVLPANQYATYESPIGGYCGPVSGVWGGGLAPNGGAFVTEGIDR